MNNLIKYLKITFIYLLLLVAQIYLYSILFHYAFETEAYDLSIMSLTFFWIIYLMIAYTISISYNLDDSGSLTLIDFFFSYHEIIESYVDENGVEFHYFRAYSYGENSLENLNFLRQVLIFIHSIFLPLTMPIVSLLYYTKHNIETRFLTSDDYKINKEHIELSNRNINHKLKIQ